MIFCGGLRELVDSYFELGEVVVVVRESLKLVGRVVLGLGEECSVICGVSDFSWIYFFRSLGLEEGKGSGLLRLWWLGKVFWKRCCSRFVKGG